MTPDKVLATSAVEVPSRSDETDDVEFELREDDIPRKQGHTTFHLRMHGLRLREFSLRHYCEEFRQQGRDGCNSILKNQNRSLGMIRKKVHQNMPSTAAAARYTTSVNVAVEHNMHHKSTVLKDSGTTALLKRVHKTVTRLPIPDFKRTLTFCALAALAMPAAAFDQELASIGRTAAANFINPDHIPRVAAGSCTGLILFLGGYVTGAAKSLLAPLMGITSILWFIMRNDAAVSPGLSWIMFGAWSVLTLIYLSLECRRVTYHKLYVLITLAFGGICLCIVALVQKSAIQGGLVTAIPPCTSFAAYAVGFFFPCRLRRQQLVMV